MSDSRISRRALLAGATGLGLSVLWSRTSSAQPAPVEPTHEPLRKITEIGSHEGRLRAELSVTTKMREMPGLGVAIPVRAFSGTDVVSGTCWPPPELDGQVLPGPTFRAQMGDFVEIKFFNEADTSFFGDEGIDKGETGKDGGCDVLPVAGGALAYPIAADAYPNCFHASSTTNVHFHGFHVTPDGLGDNVLLKVRPRLNLPKEIIRPAFEAIFESTRNGTPPQNWGELPPEWTKLQLEWLADHDSNAVWYPNGTDPEKLPEELGLLPAAQAQIDAGLWPQYQVGAYPFSFRITQKGDVIGGGHNHGSAATASVGQAPGTHWYHPHVHGSTAINVLHGMAGVFIVEGEYDKRLKQRLGEELVEHVLIVQQFAQLPRRMSGSIPPFLPHVNGQLKPLVSMRPGEVQLWRLVNATVYMVSVVEPFSKVGQGPDIPFPTLQQTAQDGIQFSRAAFNAQPFLSGTTAVQNFAPGNRIDLLIKAPSLPAGVTGAEFDFNLTGSIGRGLLRVRVSGAANDMPTPDENVLAEDHPLGPDIAGEPPPSTNKTLEFTEASGNDPILAGPRINGVEFEDGRYDHTLVLGDTEDWTLKNTQPGDPHPFHIHINPFQVMAVTSGGASRSVAVPVWQDTAAIPPLGQLDIRHRFDDFTGSFVLHCHLLEHEDRGMMQLVRVISGEAPIRHH